MSRKHDRDSADDGATGKALHAAVHAGAVHDEASSEGKLSRKAYDRELKKLHVELVKLQQWVVAQGPQGLHRVRRARRCRQGRHDQGDHRAGEPAGVPRDCAARADRAREVPDVRAALPAAPAGGRGDRDLRSQLVQPRGRRARDGFLHRGAGAGFPESGAAVRAVDDQFRRHPAQVLAGGESRGADAATEGADRRRAQDLEALADGRQVLRSLGRLHEGARRDVRRHRYVMGAVVRRPLRGQEAGAAQRHHAPAEAGSVQDRSSPRRSSCPSARSAATRPSTFRSSTCPKLSDRGAAIRRTRLGVHRRRRRIVAQVSPVPV